MCEYSYVKEKELYDTFKSAVDSSEVEHVIDVFYEFLVENGSSEMLVLYEATVRLLVGMEKEFLRSSGMIPVATNSMSSRWSPREISWKLKPMYLNASWNYGALLCGSLTTTIRVLL